MFAWISLKLSILFVTCCIIASSISEDAFLNLELLTASINLLIISWLPFLIFAYSFAYLGLVAFFKNIYSKSAASSANSSSPAAATPAPVGLYLGSNIPISSPSLSTPSLISFVVNCWLLKDNLVVPGTPASSFIYFEFNLAKYS